MGRVALESVGCKLNQAEIESMARQFAEAGYELVSPLDGADIYVLNTCTVTHIADRKCRQLLRSARRRNPAAFVVATGCYAERAAGVISQIEGVDLVVGNDDKERLAEIVGERRNGAALGEAGRRDAGPISRTRALVKIMDGCNRSCAYCIVPRVRGRERSVPMSQVVSEVKARVNEGYQEVVLTGPQIGSYGRDRQNGANLQHLIERILAETRLERLRLTSLQPQDITPSLIELWSDKRLCRHLHLPLQSGGDPVLRRMRRGYSIADYETSMLLARELVPDIAVTTDVIVGFPGEGEEEFEASYRFCERMGFSRLHVFPFSPRPGTFAAEMPNQVPERVKKERMQRMLELAERSAQQFREQFLGQTMPVLWETRQDGEWAGLTDNYVRVFTRSPELLSNRLLPAKLISGYKQGLFGELQGS